MKLVLLFSLLISSFSHANCLEKTKTHYLKKYQDVETNVAIRNNLALGGSNVLWAVTNPIIAAGALAAGAAYVSYELLTKEQKKQNYLVLTSKEIAFKENSKFINRLTKKCHKFDSSVNKESMVEMIYEEIESGELCPLGKAPSLLKIQKHIFQLCRY